MTRSGKLRLATGLACALTAGVIAGTAALGGADPTTTTTVGGEDSEAEGRVAGYGPLSERQAQRLAASIPNQPPATEPQRTRPRQRGPYGEPVEDTVEPRMLPPGSDGPFSTTQLWPVRNGWKVGNHRRFTAVYAGGDGVADGHNSTGRFLIFRSDYIRVTQNTKVVDELDIGPVKIAKAPLGEGIQGWAQRRGRLRFVSDRGATGVLDLRTDKIILDGR